MESKVLSQHQVIATQGTKKMYRKPLFRGNSTADPDDIRSPHFDDCAVPLVWWPWWPENPSDFFLTSVAPFHAMLHGGVIDKNIKYTPVMEGLKQPGYFQWYSDPITIVSLKPPIESDALLLSGNLKILTGPDPAKFARHDLHKAAVGLHEVVIDQASAVHSNLKHISLICS